MLADKLNSVLDAFKTKYPALIGVDVSSTAIKLVELAEAGKGTYRLERYAIEPLVRDVVTDGNIANLDLVADALKRAHKRLGTRSKHWITSCSTHTATVGTTRRTAPHSTLKGATSEISTTRASWRIPPTC